MSCCNVEHATNCVRIADCWKLLKPRVMYLVVFTFLAGMIIAPGSTNLFIAFVAVFCVALGCGASGAFNMWYDRDIDAIMSRTKSRPIPSGAVNPDAVLEFSIIAAVLSVFLMALVVNYVAAFLLMISILSYTLLYTAYLKRRTPQNIVIGGIAGAFPPMIGWSVVTGSFSWESLVLFAIIFMWTPPHFWSLSLLISSDYEKAKIPMMPVEYGIKYTTISILVYTIFVFVISLLPGIFLKHALLYEIVSVSSGIAFLGYAISLFRAKTEKSYRIMFFYSIFYLFIIFFTIILCSVF